ncbi:MAG: hypothetical protein KQH63_14420 [Desulfobulbaceae bacterium]|nr:hypothetical protein [Desulfobulbaceae bacterium]
MKRKIKYSLAAVLTSALISGTSFTAAAATVQVYADATYTDTNMVVNIMADVDASDGDPLVSSGVTLSYNNGELANPVAEKNENVWYFGDGTVAGNYSYIAPAIDAGAGQVVFLLGRIDSTETDQSGVSGTGVLLGTVTFDRNTSDVPVADEAGTFGISVSLGKDRTTYPSYVNFASKAGSDLDGSVTYDSTSYTADAPCVLVGDFDGSNAVDLVDYGIFRANYGQTGVNPADLDGSGTVDLVDYGIFRANYGTSCP